MNQQRSLIQYPLKLQPVSVDQPLAHATGLLCYPSGRTTLVTNWHVVSGKDAFTGKHLNESKQMPTILRVSVALCEVERKSLEKTPNGRKETELRTPLLRSCDRDVPLYEDGTPRWKEHPTLGRICDVVALDIDSECRSLMTRLNPKGYHTVPGTTCEPFSTWVDRRDDMQWLFSSTESFDLDSDVVVVGFPHLPVSPPTFVPMTKRGAVASPPSTELYYDGMRLPAFYMDILTRPGFSGSPVFWRSTGVLFEKTGERTVNLSNVDVGPRYSFLGIYSSRMKELETKEPIYGICWTKAAVEAVCDSKATPENPAIEPPESVK